MEDTTSLVFTGDIGFDKYMDGKWADEQLISTQVLEFLHSGRHVVANVEGPLIALPKNEGVSGVQQLLHAMDPAATKVFARMQADIWNLCNNHILDAGEEGVAATLEEACKFGAKTIGAGRNIEEAARPLVLEEAGGIGIFSVGYRRGCKPADADKAGCLLWNDMERIQENINKIKQTCRWCIIVSHGGEEFTSLPSPYTRERYLAFLEMGADAVVAHHPHVPMNYETVGEKVIFYSLGNFIFDTDYQRSQFNTDLGLLIKLNFTADKMSWEPFGLRIDREVGRILVADLPDIFVDVQEDEYKLLAPLAAKMMVAAYKRQLLYLKPEVFRDATEEEWEASFLAERRSGRVPGEGLDFQIMYPLAQKAEEGAWELSKLEGVKRYILGQM